MAHDYFYSKLPELDPNRFGLSSTDTYDFKGILNVPIDNGTVDNAVTLLDDIYSGPLSTEFSYLEVSTVYFSKFYFSNFLQNYIFL